MKNFFLKLPEEQVHIWVIRTDADDMPTKCYSNVLDKDELNRMGRFRFEKDRRAFMLSHSALRFILSCYLGCLPKEITYQKNEFGKPFVGSPKTSLHFNLSHSCSYALIAVSHCPIGVDIEYQNLNVSTDLIAKRFFQTQEYRTYRMLKGKEKFLGFYRLWTKKEALAKALGLSISHILECRSALLSCTLKPDEVSIYGKGMCIGKWYIENLDLKNLLTDNSSKDLNNYTAAICLSMYRSFMVHRVFIPIALNFSHLQRCILHSSLDVLPSKMNSN